jgi:protein gp37
MNNTTFSNNVRKAYSDDHDAKPLLRELELSAPSRLRKPAVIGVQFMGDLFHKDVPDEFINDVLRTMIFAPQHTFLVLTKRPKRMADLIYDFLCDDDLTMENNIWWGISAENQETLDERGKHLIRIPGNLFLSLEPCLGPIIVPPMIFESVDWCVIGAETGPKKRECKPEWINMVVEQFRLADKPIWVKSAPPGAEVVREKPIGG